MDSAQFRTDFPQFADITVYPDASVDFWLSVAALSLNPDAWGTLLDFGTELFVAHQLTVATSATLGNNAGGAMGLMGPVTSKAVDKVSVGYGANAATSPDAGFWNLSVYGVQYWRYLQMVGAGGIQLPQNSGPLTPYYG